MTIINERKFYQEGKPESVPLRVLFAATNEVPEQGELAALKDRFVLKVLVVAAVAGAGFGYYSWALKADDRTLKP